MSTKAQANRILRSFRDLGQIQTIAIGPAEDGLYPLYDGHQRVAALFTVKTPDYELLALQSNRQLTEDERRQVAVLLHTATGSWDWNALSGWSAADLREWGMDSDTLKGWGNDVSNLTALLSSEEENKNLEDGSSITLAERFGVPPFSVLDARQGYWQDRKRAWLALGIQSELGRGENLQGLSESNDEYRYNGHTVRGDGKGRKATAKDFGSGGAGELAASFKSKDNGLLGESEQARSHYKKDVNGLLMKSDSGNDPEYYFKKQQKEKELGRELSTAEFQQLYYEGTETYQTGTSIFDPVLCELAYRWFMPAGEGKILDPFAGGSVRGIVASKLGKDYTGIDLSARQIEANKVQGAELCPDKMPNWINGDSVNIKELAAAEYDFVFSCPPYADLEIYSDDPADLSRMEYDDFIKAYRAIIAGCVSMLKDNRFACFVVGDVRDNKGFYRNFPADTIQAFEDAGAILYNEAILVTAIGSLPIRVGRQFDGGRKLGKTHQNVLVFYKGNPKAIKDFGAVEFGKFEGLEGADEIPN